MTTPTSRPLFLMASAMTFLLSLSSCCDQPEQRLSHYQDIIQELSSAPYQGRAYGHDGVLKAGDFIASEFQRSGVRDVQRQSFTIDINTFPGQMEAVVDGRSLTPGIDFTLREFSPGVHGRYGLVFVDTLNASVERLKAQIDSASATTTDSLFFVCDFWQARKQPLAGALQAVDSLVAGTINTWNEPLKFYKAYGETVRPKPLVWTTAAAIAGASSIQFDIDNRFFSGYQSDNIIAHIPGRRADSCFVFTAHYDHLGNLGADVFYPGANDNASGTAAIITLAEYYAKHRPAYDMWFLAVAGEEANLRGSTYFAEHPLMPLEQIRYLVNIDMIGDNGPRLYCEPNDAGKPLQGVWEQVNSQVEAFDSLRWGELAANSDHYPFAVRGVPVIFIQNEGGDVIHDYHTVNDTCTNATFASFEPVFNLITGFVTAVAGK